jgi:dTDP-4-amino-4,6-dideoxygalactose transaminase
MDPLMQLAESRRIKVIEDASHAFGAEWTDRQGVRRKVGGCSHSDMTTFSFHPVKHITTGEGGMVLTNQPELRDRLRSFRHHGIEAGGGQMQELGFNYRITDFQCALGLSQLERADSFLARREELAEAYRQRLEGLSLRWQSVGDGARHAWHLRVAQLPLEELSVSRDDLLKRLRELGIGVQVHYLPVHLQPYYRRVLGTRQGDFPAAESYHTRALTLPLFPRMKDSELDQVVRAVRELLSGVSRKEPAWNSNR